MRREALCGGAQACDRLRPCWCEACGREWSQAGEPDSCPRCGTEDCRHLHIERCYECPADALEESMRGALGQTIERVFRIRNLMDCGVQFRPADLTAEEARLLEVIGREKGAALNGNPS